MQATNAIITNLALKVESLSTGSALIHSCKSKTASSHITNNSNKVPQSLTFSEVVKKHVKSVNISNQHEPAHIQGNNATGISPDNILVLSGNIDKTKCQNHSMILNELSKHFPCIKLISSSLKHNGLIFLSFATHDDAAKVCNGWQPTIFGSVTKINFYKKGSNNLVIIKNVPNTITEADLLSKNNIHHVH